VRFLTSFRISSAKWAAMLLLPAVWFLVIEWARFAQVGFGTAVAEAASFPVFAIAALCSACATWEAGRLRRSRIWSLAPVHTRLRVAANALLPVVTLACAAIGLGLVAGSVDLGVLPDGAGASSIASTLAVVLSYIIIGFSLGCVVHRTLAAPLMLLGVYLWMTVPASSNVMWIRHLTGEQITSSTVTDSVSFTAFIAPVLLSGGVAIGLALLSSTIRPKALRGGVAMSCAVVGTLLAYLMVANWGPDAPMIARTGATVCAQSKPKICVPREFEPQIPRFHKAATEVMLRLKTAGLDAPDTLALVSKRTEVSSTTWRFDPSPEESNEALRVTVALSAIPALPDCFADNEGYSGSKEGIRSWLLLTAGVDRDTVASQADPKQMRSAIAALKMSKTSQIRWFHSTIRALKSCSATPEPADAAS